MKTQKLTLNQLMQDAEVIENKNLNTIKGGLNASELLNAIALNGVDAYVGSYHFGNGGGSDATSFSFDQTTSASINAALGIGGGGGGGYTTGFAAYGGQGTYNNPIQLNEVKINGNRNNTSSLTPWMTIAQSQLGQREIPGNLNNPAIIGYHATTGNFKDDETPWCSSFVNWSMTQAGVRGTNSAQALSWKKWGQILDRPAYGSVAVIDYGAGKGHTGFVAGISPNGSIVLIGGNQSNMVKHSNFLPSSIDRYTYPTGYSPNYNLPTIRSGKEGSFNSTR